MEFWPVKFFDMDDAAVLSFVRFFLVIKSKIRHLIAYMF